MIALPSGSGQAAVISPRAVVVPVYGEFAARDVTLAEPGRRTVLRAFRRVLRDGPKDIDFWGSAKVLASRSTVVAVNTIRYDDDGCGANACYIEIPTAAALRLGHRRLSLRCSTLPDGMDVALDGDVVAACGRVRDLSSGISRRLPSLPDVFTSAVRLAGRYVAIRANPADPFASAPPGLAPATVIAVFDWRSGRPISKVALTGPALYPNFALGRDGTLVFTHSDGVAVLAPGEHRPTLLDAAYRFVVGVEGGRALALGPQPSDPVLDAVALRGGATRRLLGGGLRADGRAFVAFDGRFLAFRANHAVVVDDLRAPAT